MAAAIKPSVREEVKYAINFLRSESQVSSIQPAFAKTHGMITELFLDTSGNETVTIILSNTAAGLCKPDWRSAAWSFEEFLRDHSTLLDDPTLQRFTAIAKQIEVEAQFCPKTLVLLKGLVKRLQSIHAKSKTIGAEVAVLKCVDTAHRLLCNRQPLDALEELDQIVTTHSAHLDTLDSID